MKHKIALYAFVPLLSLSMFGAQAASAHGMGGLGRGMGMGKGMRMFGGFAAQTPDQIAARGQVMFDSQAKMLGITVDEIKDAWAQGKTTQDIIKEKNISKADIAARMKAAQDEQVKVRFKALVDKGVITQAQAEARAKAMQTKVDARKNKTGGIFGRFHF